MNGRPSHYREPAPTIQRGDIAALYRSRDTDPLRASLGKMYQPPDIFEHGRKTLVATVKATNPDGGDVQVFETRMPAAFYAIESRGTRMATGSGGEVATLIAAIAFELAAGMLVVTVAGIA